jgi:hypothetical protein
VLGPLLFLLYVNDIADNTSLGRLMLKNTIALVFWGLKFTNHCLDHIDIDSKSLFITSSIVYGLGQVSIWSKQWLVNFNPQKTKAMVFSNINLPNDVEITFQDKLVEFVTCHKHGNI